jgi:hypothetical protein
MERRIVLEGKFDSSKIKKNTLQESRKIKLPVLKRKINFKNLIKFFCF